MDFDYSDKTKALQKRLQSFMDEYVYPAEGAYAAEIAANTAAGKRWTPLQTIENLKPKAQAAGLWNLFLPAESGLSNLEYAPLAEISGWSVEILPEAMNCQAPDTGNMEILHMFGTHAQQEQWLEPLLDGTIRSGFAMTEPHVASSDATNIECSIRRDGDAWVINGTKWWTSGANDPRCRVLVVMGKTDPDAPAHRQQSMVLVPLDTPGVTVERSLTVFGRQDQAGQRQ
jgi:acyl-CoA dehydrogenase